ncbi:MAG TPA: putative ABC exporter domain-containing protein [Candidatus Baltobacteraceae bacterium]|nr:putative ABC exporter domain-containing protein [Candidatus Baltobacteraceae bacterium]
MQDLNALLFLEWRQAVHRLRSILSSPGRAIFYLLVVAYFIAMAVLRGSRYHAQTAIAEPFASAILFAFITLVGVLAYGAASGVAGVFASPADARFLAGSQIDDRLVVFWLQLRRSVSALVRTTLSMLLYVALVAHDARGIGVGLAILGGTLGASAVAVPMLKVRARMGTRIAQACAGAIVAIGVFPLLAVLSGTFRPSPVQLGVERLGGGHFVNALFAGDARALAAFWLLSALLVVLAWFTGGDLYPDLYAASSRVFELRKRARSGAGTGFTAQRRYRNIAASGGLTALFGMARGSWAIVWKDWIGFVRMPGQRQTYPFGLAAGAVIGFLIGLYAVHSRSPLETMLVIMPVLFFFAVMWLSMGAAVSLRIDIAKPIWWFGADSLQQRLFAWVCATSWRTALFILVTAIAWAVAMREPLWALYALPCVLALVCYMRATGLAMYAIFPSSIDQRGPMGSVRALLTYLLGAPPLVAIAIVLGLSGGRAPVAAIVLVAVAVASAEVYVLIAFAASRISGRGFAIAQAEGT